MSRKAAIDEKCKDCIYDEAGTGNWRQQVTLCAVKSCPLYEYRPKSSQPIPESVIDYYGIKKGTLEHQILNPSLGIGEQT